MARIVALGELLVEMVALAPDQGFRRAGHLHRPGGAHGRLSAELPLVSDTGLHYYPLLKPGERFPMNDPTLAPRLAPRPSDDRLFLQGLLEGLSAIEARGYALLTAHGAPRLQRVVTTGGGACNAAWRTIRERVLGVPMSTITDRPAALGVAHLARSGWMAQH